PNDDALATSINEDSDWRHALSLQGEYNLRSKHDFFAMRTGYSFYATKQNEIGFYNVQSHDASLQPAWSFSKITVAFPLHYNYVVVDDKQYLDTTGMSVLVNKMQTSRDMLQTQFQYNIKNFHWPASFDDENRDSREYVWSAGWYYFFTKKQDGYAHIRYAANFDDAKGDNWKYWGNRLTASVVVPLLQKVSWTVVGDYFRQEFLKENHSVYRKERHNDVYTFSNLLAYRPVENLEVQFQHTFVYDGASIGVYKYKKNVYGVGVKYYF
ncbi:MAG: hypothetical protein KBA46_08300, partial [Candidatus Omnitrophica bacterium]|nr:hypothetical protein [Candidatus Omnitrophota bacterium]